MNKNQEKMVILWERGLGVSQISEELNLANGYISRSLKQIYGDSKEKRFIYTKRKYSLDENFFSSINCEANAYYLGLLAADGCLETGSNSVKLALQDRDVNILKRFRDELKTEKPLYYKKENPNLHARATYVLEMSSGKIRKDLEKLGLTTRKSLTIEYPNNIPSNLIHHYLRGYFDGDGSIYKGGKTHHAVTATFAGNVQYCNGVSSYLNSIGISSKVTKHIFQNCHYSQIKGANNILKLYDFLYKDATIFIERKKNTFDEWINFRNNNKGSHNKPIIQYDLEGNFIREWTTAAMASRFLNNPYLSASICGCCKGYHKTAGGFKWGYKIN